MPFRQHPRQLFTHSLRAHLPDLVRRRLHRTHRLRLNREPEPRRKPHPPQHAQLVLRKPHPRVPDRPHNPSLEILAPTHKVQHRPGYIAVLLKLHRIEQHPVDREVPPDHILPRLGRKPHCIRAPPIRVHAIVAKGSDLGGNLLPIHLAPQAHQHHPKVRPHRKRLRK